MYIVTIIALLAVAAIAAAQRVHLVYFGKENCRGTITGHTAVRLDECTSIGDQPWKSCVTRPQLASDCFSVLTYTEETGLQAHWYQECAPVSRYGDVIEPTMRCHNQARSSSHEARYSRADIAIARLHRLAPTSRNATGPRRMSRSHLRSVLISSRPQLTSTLQLTMRSFALIAALCWIVSAVSGAYVTYYQSTNCNGYLKHETVQFSTNQCHNLKTGWKSISWTKNNNGFCEGCENQKALWYSKTCADAGGVFYAHIETGTACHPASWPYKALEITPP